MGQDHPSNRLGFSGTDLETGYRVHLLVSKYPGKRERREREGARLAGEGGQSAMQEGQPRKPGGGSMLQSRDLVPFIIQSLDTGLPWELAFCNKEAVPEVGGQGDRSCGTLRSWAACSP